MNKRIQTQIQLYSLWESRYVTTLTYPEHAITGHGLQFDSCTGYLEWEHTLENLSM
jgi:hypothetical protein